LADKEEGGGRGHSKVWSTGSKTEKTRKSISWGHQKNIKKSDKLRVNPNVQKSRESTKLFCRRKKKTLTKGGESGQTLVMPSIWGT